MNTRVEQILMQYRNQLLNQKSDDELLGGVILASDVLNILKKDFGQTITDDGGALLDTELSINGYSITGTIRPHRPFDSQDHFRLYHVQFNSRFPHVYSWALLIGDEYHNLITFIKENVPNG